MDRKEETTASPDRSRSVTDGAVGSSTGHLERQLRARAKARLDLVDDNHYLCPECGGLADVRDSMAERDRLVVHRLQIPLDQWDAFDDAVQSSTEPVQAKTLLGLTQLSLDDADSDLRLASQMLLLTEQGDGYGPDRLYCPACYRRAEAEADKNEVRKVQRSVKASVTIARKGDPEGPRGQADTRLGRERAGAAATTSVSTRARPFSETVRNPSGVGVLLWILLSIVPLVWPFSLYVLLRYLTGHRAPWSRGPLPPDTRLGHQVRYPSLLGIAIAWVIGVFTGVGYILAIYMTYRYVNGNRANGMPMPGSASLTDRLAQLDTARNSGLITAEEHEAKRAAILESL